ncbi:MAG: tol-pal system YbgF family protein [Promethearchaeota archaeon]
MIRKVITGWLFTISLVLICLNLKADNTPLKLGIDLSKEIYVVSEPIWLDMTLTNINQDTVRTFGPCIPCGDTKLQILNEKGDTLPYVGVKADFAGSGHLMQSGEQIYNCHNILDYYGDREDLIRFRLRPGTYSVQATYYGSKSGIISSQKTNFEVREPEGSEKEALRLLKNGYSAQITKESDSAIENFETLIQKFPKSVYVETAYFYLAASYQIYKGDTEKCRNVRIETLEKFPDSGYSRGIIAFLVRGKDSSQQKNIMIEITKEHPNTRAAKFAQKKLDKLEDEK